MGALSIRTDVLPARLTTGLIGCLLFLSLGRASSIAESAEWQSIRIDGVPHVRQKPDFCGEACAEMYLRKLRLPFDQDAVFDLSGLDPTLGRGCYTRDLIRALSAIGFDTGSVWSQIPIREATSKLNEAFAALHADLVAGVPSIVCMRYDERPAPTEHFRLVLGYDSDTDQVLFHDPAVADSAYRRMGRPLFLKLWPLKYDEEKSTLIRLRLKTTEALGQTGKGRAHNAAYAQHILKLRAKLPRGNFVILLERPFVVIGNEDRETVRHHAEHTVKWAIERLKQDYFTWDPSQIIDIWLFQDATSYEENAEKLFGARPTTPYGYYLSRHHALVMNIATGGGTLVHEIVHPYIAANFPDCPSWFNEGLASLYEASGERDGHLIGLVNWRLPALQRALRKGTVPPFKTLCETTTDEFYNHDRGSNYSQARYLCYYLQERGLLIQFYQAFRRKVASDPTGYGTLKAILREEDMAEFQKRWKDFVLELKFEG
jgi:Peptidase_C39 like family